MARVVEVLAALEARGVKVWATDGEIRFRGPKHADNAADLAALKAAKDETLALLAEREARAPVQAAKPPARPRRIPLSASQDMWFRPDNPERIPAEIRRTPSLFRVTGELDLAVLRQTLEGLSRRHEILRTRYRYDGKSKWQEVKDRGDAGLETVDLTGQARPAQEEHILQRVRRVFREPPDHDAGEALHTLVFTLSPREHCLVLVIDHIALDNRSMSILVRELFTLYHAIAAGGADPFPDPAPQYADFAIWDNQGWTPQALAQSEQRWLERATDLSPVQLYDGAYQDKVISTPGRELIAVHEEARRSIVDFARRESLSTTVIFHTAFAALLASWRGLDRLMVGCVIDERPAAMRDAVGSFIRTGPLIVDLAGGPTARQALERVRQSHLEIIDPKNRVRTALFTGLANVAFNIQRREVAPMAGGRDRAMAEAAQGIGATRLARFSALRPRLPSGEPDPIAAMVVSPPPSLETEADGRRLGVGPWRLTRQLNENVYMDFQVYMFERPDMMHGQVIFAADRIAPARAAWFCRSLQPLMLRIAARPDEPLMSLVPSEAERPAPPPRPDHALAVALEE